VPLLVAAAWRTVGGERRALVEIVVLVAALAAL